MEDAGIFRRFAPAAFAAHVGSNWAVPQCGSRKAIAMQHYQEEQARAQQYAQAMEWCKTNGKGAWAAAHRVDHDGTRLWPLINHGCLGQRLAGRVDNENDK